MVVIIEELLDESESSVSQQRASSSVRQGEDDEKESKKQAKLEKNRLKKQKDKDRKKQRKTMDPKFWGKNMDPKVWGNLPPNLTLEIYKKLPIRSFYQLREVCKEWNRVARERRCVTDPIHKPYFLLIHEGDDKYEHDQYLHGILTFHIKSGRWRWNELRAIPFVHFVCLMYKPFSVKGLGFSCDSPDRYRVLDVHTRQEYIVPRQPKISKKSRAVGMTVDTSVVPHTFKIVLGSLDIGTQIYDSVRKSWETRPSRLVPCQDGMFASKSCFHCGDRMYIWADLGRSMRESDKVFLVYSPQEDKWSMLEPPLQYENDLHGLSLGSWQGRIFTVTFDCWHIHCDHSLGEDEDGFPITAHLIFVWELLDHPKPNYRGDESLWEEVDEMPIDMQKWLIPLRLHEYEEVQVSANFCDEHVLIYSWVPEEGRAYRFILYNLATKKWEKVEAPNRAVSINADDEKDTQKWDVEDLYSNVLSEVFREASMMGQEELFARSLLDCFVGGNSSDIDDGIGIPMFEYDDSSDESWY